MALKDTENMAISHFNNICLSLVIFTLRTVCCKHPCVTLSVGLHALYVTTVVCLHTVAAHP